MGKKTENKETDGYQEEDPGQSKEKNKDNGNNNKKDIKTKYYYKK